MIYAEVVCDSVAQNAPRLHSQLWRYPKMVHQESLRHRRLYIEDALLDPDFSFSVSSSRAIPTAKLLEEVRRDDLRAEPVLWGAERKGMSPGEELPDDSSLDLDLAKKILRFSSLLGISCDSSVLTPRGAAKLLWKVASLAEVQVAEMMLELGLHKSIVNRRLDPSLHVNCLVTGSEPGWMNWFGLRLDGHADPTLRALAEATWRAWGESGPRDLRPGEWHLPFIDQQSLDSINNLITSDVIPVSDHENERIIQTGVSWFNRRCLKVSAARCARVSYLSFETGKRSTIEEDLRLYDRLVGSSPMHLSPTEHQATPDRWIESDWVAGVGRWKHAAQHGNLPGWRQARKMIPGEAVAPLPESYR